MEQITVWFRIEIHMFLCYKNPLMTVSIPDNWNSEKGTRFFLFRSGMQMMKTKVKKPRHMTEWKYFGETLLLAWHRFGDSVTTLLWKRNIPYNWTMNKAEVGTDNIYFEMDTKNGTEARTYDEATDKSDIPATKRESIERSAQESKKKRQPTKETGTVAFRPIQLIAAALVAVAFLTAVATLVLALTMMLSQNSLTASKDSDPDVYGEWQVITINK